MIEILKKERLEIKEETQDDGVHRWISIDSELNKIQIYCKFTSNYQY